MGRVTKVFASGVIGNVIFYERLGTACARSMPGRVRQTAATKTAAGVFGRAKTISKQLREGLNGLLLRPKAREVMYITDNAVATWLRAGDLTVSGAVPPPLAHLEFSSKAGFYERFKKRLNVDWSATGKVTVSIPQLDVFHDIVAPAHTASVQLMLAVTASALNGTPVKGSMETVEIDHKQGMIPAKQVVLSLTESTNSLYLVVAALRYSLINKGLKEIVQGEQWLPASVVSGYFNA